jgi:hypothetical protein
MNRASLWLLPLLLSAPGCGLFEPVDGPTTNRAAGFFSAAPRNDARFLPKEALAQGRPLTKEETAVAKTDDACCPPKK